MILGWSVEVPRPTLPCYWSATWFVRTLVNSEATIVAVSSGSPRLASVSEYSNIAHPAQCTASLAFVISPVVVVTGALEVVNLAREVEGAAPFKPPQSGPSMNRLNTQREQLLASNPDQLA
jgi:hypothetical protein